MTQTAIGSLLTATLAAGLMAGAGACSLDDEGKRTCATGRDCLDGHVCIDRVCVDPADAPDGGDDITFADASDDTGGGEGSGDPPTLTCNPATAVDEELCDCMADIVCDQIDYCLTDEELAGKPDNWSPPSDCVASLLEDCLEDLASDPVEYFPADFAACVADLGDATCDDFSDFSSVSGDFPPSCQNLRALDTGLGIGP